MKKITFDLIECAKGWQVEATLPGNFTCFSGVMPTKEEAVAAAQKLAKLLNLVCVFNPVETVSQTSQTNAGIGGGA